MYDCEPDGQQIQMLGRWPFCNDSTYTEKQIDLWRGINWLNSGHDTNSKLALFSIILLKLLMQLNITYFSIHCQKTLCKKEK